MRSASSPELIILDVGHGNCALLLDTDGIVLIDCPPVSTVMEALKHLDVDEIAHVLISHADQDHIGGLIPLLLNTNIANVHLNSDWIRDTDIWLDICLALDEAHKSGVKLEAQLTTDTTGRHNVGEVSLEILAPSPVFALTGIGGRELSGKRKINANSMSAVISFVYKDRRVAILPGDLDQIGLDSILSNGSDIRADILVFPHHGGRPGKGVDPKSFAIQLCELVKPQCVVFSIDRTRHNNPRDEIIEGVLSAVPDVHIVCTQLSQKCAKDLPTEVPDHLTVLPASGRTDNKCCGGTIRLVFGEDSYSYEPSPQAHKGFVEQYPGSLCCQFLPQEEQI
jgi:competence protein ComEC